MESTGKSCAICGEDTSDRPRTRDKRGRYYCKICYESAKERKRLAVEVTPPSPAVAAAGKPPPQTHEIALEPLASASPRSVLQPREQASACTACGAALASEAVICLSCGFDRRTGEHVNVRALRAAAPVPPRERATWFMAPVYLFVRPSRFYKQFVVDPAPVLTALFAWLYGMAGAMDRIDSRMMSAQISGRASGIPDSWGVHWGMILGGGIIAGLFYAALGGWWYRLRLKWCAVADPDRAMVRRVYLTSSAVYALPAVVWRVVQSMTYARPSDVWNADFHIVDLLVLLALGWSIWISYVGVRTVFGAAMWRASIWFLLLPGLLYFLAIGAVALAALLISNAPPDVGNPATHAAPGFSFQYPSNWDFDRQDPDFDPARDIYIDSPQGAMVHIMLYDAEGEEEDHLAWTVNTVKMAMIRPRDDGAIQEWGSLRGEGRIYSGSLNGEPATYRIFVSEVRQGVFLEIQEFTPASEAARVEPGMALIRSSFKVR